MRRTLHTRYRRKDEAWRRYGDFYEAVILNLTCLDNMGLYWIIFRLIIPPVNPSQSRSEKFIMRLAHGHDAP